MKEYVLSLKEKQQHHNLSYSIASTTIRGAVGGTSHY